MSKSLAIPVIVVVSLAVIAAAAYFYIFKEREHLTYTFYPMSNIPMNITAYNVKPLKFYKAINDAKRLADVLEQIFNRFNDSSEISEINASLDTTPRKISPYMLELLLNSQKWHQKSDGAFDITIKPLISLWTKGEERGSPPTNAEILEAQKFVGMGNLTINPPNMTISAGKKGMALDVGGIAKGFMADEIAELLEDHGIKSGIVDVGGNMKCFGDRVFNIGIADPLAKDDSLLMATVKTLAGGVVTSGDYRRFVEIGGRRYSHIIDPKSGHPVDLLISVTIIAGNATDADALATAVSVLGRERGIRLIKGSKNIYAVMAERAAEGSYKVWYSKELGPDLTLYEKWKGDIEGF